MKNKFRSDFFYLFKTVPHRENTVIPTKKDVVKIHKKRLIKQNTKQNNDRHEKVTSLTPTT